ncbi:VOC family protein [Martelella mediterranea]|uniref:Lactoylglutathione lyase n=1 Tax=Martelella mediterranea TaxID=293089 RepID=A0A4R3NJ10_9HYPH|nr:VOC family protein [Martelella mediterranea]TCT33003.1 lactoylglutathione lyase [Martelella mediterranea]
MIFTGIGHVAIRCTDIDRSLAFYTDVFGFPEMFRLNQDDGRVWLVYLRVTNTLYLELFPDGDGNKVPGPNATGYNHLCVETGDIDAAAKHIEALGVPLVKPVVTGRDGNRQCWIDDPDGNRIEIMQMMPDCMQFAAIKAMKPERS